MSSIEVYQEDFVIYAIFFFDKTVAKFNKFLHALKDANLTLNLAKCLFHLTSIDFLGFLIDDNKVFPLNVNMQKIHSFSIPKMRKYVEKFFGLARFYRTLIPSFAQLIKPFFALTSSKAELKWI